MAAKLEWGESLRQGETPPVKDRIRLIVQLSVPAILAEISSIAMQYIDAAMVGSLGAAASASIGLVSSTTWLFGGMCMALATGFSVQVAHLVGAEKLREARNVLRQALIAAAIFGLLLSAIGILLSSRLPAWLRGDADIRPDASRYFFIYACALPALQFRAAAGSILQCSGDMRTPSVLNILMCFFDVVFNSLLIFPTRRISLLGLGLVMPGAGMGVAGAALGTALSEVVTALLMLYALCVRSPLLRLSEGGSWRLTAPCLLSAARVGLPMALERGILSSAQIVSTRIVAPLGKLSVAANSLAVTAESLCYMPGQGIASAATTLVGQSIGAGREDMARSYARLTVAIGAGVMAFSGLLMFFFAPAAFAILTPDPAIRALGTKVLRIEVFAEPLFGVAIVTTGALRGAGDTLIPSVISLVSMWGIRITASMALAPRVGLPGVWFAMCVELCFRGLLFLVRLLRGRWLPQGKADGKEKVADGNE